MSSVTQNYSCAGPSGAQLTGRMHADGIAILKEYFCTKSQRPSTAEKQQLLQRLQSMPGHAYLQPKHIDSWFSRQRSKHRNGHDTHVHAPPGRPRAPIDKKTRELITNAVEGQSLQTALASVPLCANMFKLPSELITSFITSLYHPVASQSNLPTPTPEPDLQAKQEHLDSEDEGSDMEVDSDADVDPRPARAPAREMMDRLPTPVSPVFSTRQPPQNQARPTAAVVRDPSRPKQDSTVTQVLLEIDKEISSRESVRPSVARMSAQELQANWDAREGRMASLLAALSR